MVSFQHGNMDPQGNYRGTSYGCGVASLLFLGGIFVTAVVIGWPFMVIHGPLAWLVEIPWILVAGTVGLVVLSKRAGRQDREKP